MELRTAPLRAPSAWGTCSYRPSVILPGITSLGIASRNNFQKPFGKLRKSSTMMMGTHGGVNSATSNAQTAMASCSTTLLSSYSATCATKASCLRLLAVLQCSTRNLREGTKRNARLSPESSKPRLDPCSVGGTSMRLKWKRSCFYHPPCSGASYFRASFAPQIRYCP